MTKKIQSPQEVRTGLGKCFLDLIDRGADVDRKSLCDGGSVGDEVMEVLTKYEFGSRDGG